MSWLWNITGARGVRALKEDNWPQGGIGKKIVGDLDQCMVEERLMSLKRMRNWEEKNIWGQCQFIKNYNTVYKYLFDEHKLFYTNNEDYLLLWISEVAIIFPAEGCLPITIVFNGRVAQQLVPSLPRIVSRNNLYARNDEQEQVPMRNLEADFPFGWSNLILGLEVRGQPSPQLKGCRATDL